MILVVGATGALGSEVCRLLKAAGHPIRALVRSTAAAERLQHLRALGAELVTGDLKDLASLGRACDGATAVISTASSTLSAQRGDSIRSVDRDGQIALIDAAVAANASHFVHVSVSGGFDTDCALLEAKRAVERHLQRSGVGTYTILRPTCFMEIWLGPALGFDIGAAQARIFGAGEGKMSWISLCDVARFAVAALDNPAARDAVIDLGGPDALSQLEVVRLAEQIGGRAFELESISQGVLQSQYDYATDPLHKSFAAMMLAVSRGHAIPMDDTLGRFPFPTRLTTVRDYVRRTVAVLPKYVERQAAEHYN